MFALRSAVEALRSAGHSRVSVQPPISTSTIARSHSFVASVAQAALAPATPNRTTGGKMGLYVIRRLLIAVPTLLVISLIVFAILDLAPGDVVREADLQATLDMSRTPIREALQRLARDHFVTVISRRGMFVNLVRPELIARGSVDRIGTRLRICKVDRITGSGGTDRDCRAHTRGRFEHPVYAAAVGIERVDSPGLAPHE